MVQLLEKIHLNHSEIFLREDGIVEIYFKESAVIGATESKEIINAYRTILEPKKYPLLHVFEEYVTIEKSAREFSASVEGLSYSIAEAYVLTSLAHRLILNFYIKVNKPSVPTKYFQNKTDAIAWLKEFN